MIVSKCCVDELKIAQMRHMLGTRTLKKNTAAENYKTMQLLTQKGNSHDNTDAINTELLHICLHAHSNNLLKVRKEQAYATTDFVLQAVTMLSSL